MSRTEVYQLRLTPEEKAELARQAKSKGQSIAQMIRTDYGLIASNRPNAWLAAQIQAEKDALLEETPQEPSASQTWEEVRKNDEAVASVINGELANEVKLSKLIKQLEAQGNPDAEEVARKRLGM